MQFHIIIKGKYKIQTKQKQNQLNLQQTSVFEQLDRRKIKTHLQYFSIRNLGTIFQAFKIQTIFVTKNHEKLMKSESHNLIRNQLSTPQQSMILKPQESFLTRYFSSKQFIFPQFDHQLINNKFQSLLKISVNFSQEIKDFKSWILNKYPVNNYFKSILKQNNNSIKILSSSQSLNKSHLQSISTIYIGETQTNLKHGFGLEIKVYSKIQSDKIKGSYEVNPLTYFQAYEGFFQNDLKHGKGKLFSYLNNPKSPIFYFGRFINGETHDNKQALIVWKNQDFYVGKVKPNFVKEGLGVLFIPYKQQIELGTQSSNFSIQIKIENDSQSYQKVLISQWLQNRTKLQSLQSKQNDIQSLLCQTKIITQKQFYFGQTRVKYSSDTNSHIIIKQGMGQIKYLNGDIYQGSFSSDKLNGYGKYVWNNKNFYMGQFMDGQKHGSGFWKQFLTSDQYEGEYQYNKRHGKGEYRWGNGNVYKGDFRNDQRDGIGKMVWNTGQIYEGGWKDGLQNGAGNISIVKGNYDVLIRQSSFVNGIEMESVEKIKRLPSVVTKTGKSDRTINTKRTSDLSSSRLKSLPLENQQSKFKYLSSLPKINERTIIKYKKVSKQKNHSKTESIQPMIERMRKNIPRKMQENNLLHQRSLDSKMTRKLPYNNGLQCLNSPTDKTQMKKSSSFFEINKKRKMYYIELEDARQSEIIKKLSSQSKTLQDQRDQYKKVNQFLSDTLMIPIKWKNIKTKSHQFVLQRKQKILSPNLAYS